MHVTATCPSSEQRHAGGHRHVESLRVTRASRDTCHTCRLIMAPHHALNALQNTFISALTLLVTHFTRMQLLSQGDIFSNNTDYQVLTGCPCPVIVTCPNFPGWMLSGRALRPHWALDPGPGSGLLISPRPRPQSRLIILYSNVILSFLSSLCIM